MEQVTSFRKAYLTNANHRFDMASVARVCSDYRVIHHGQIFSDTNDDKIRKMVELAEDALAEFDPTQDILLLGGDPISIAVCCAYLGSNYEDFPVGKYDRELGGYYFVRI